MAVTELDRVREVLLGSEYDALLKLRGEYEDDEQFAAHVASVLTEAMQQRAIADDSIANVLAPIIDRAIAGSINQDPHKLAESLYPIMGPAIRKSISETLQQMLDNFNQLLEQSLSPRSLAWRFDAWRTGRSYSEIVLLNTLEYQVEQVFLIHRETSLLIQHVYSEYADRKDADMVSSMFSAIQDFIEDSFSVAEGDVLDTLKLGELTVLIQRGPNAVLAAVVRGRLPDNLRTTLMTTLEKIHRLKRSMLVEYEGDPDLFADTEPELRGILDIKLKSGEEPGKRKIPWLAIVALIVIGAGIGYLQFEASKVSRAMDAYLVALADVPGVLILESGRSDGVLNLEVLRDADARLLDTLDYDPTLFTPAITERQHLSLHPGIIVSRANRILSPPDGVAMDVSASVLVVSGSADVEWFNRLSSQWMAVTGIERLDTGSLVVTDAVAEATATLSEAIEGIRFSFEKQAAGIDPGDPGIDTLVTHMNRVIALAAARGKSAQFDVVGYTDDSGTRRINRQLALDRATALVSLLADRGIESDRMIPFGVFDYDPGAVSNERKVRIHVRLEQP